MAISIDWANKIISIEKSDTLLIQSVPTEIRQLDIDVFRLTLKDLEDDAEGVVFDTTHSHVAPVTVGGVTLARVVELINNYTVTFEDGQYRVNLIGANSNIADNTNVNQVSVSSANSAGLTFSEEINNQSFSNNRVYIDIIDGLPGTSFPRGTPTSPVDNYDDARTIAGSRNLNSYNLDGLLTLSGLQDISDGHWFGSSYLDDKLTMTAPNTDGTVFNDLSITGQLNGRSTFKCCFFNGVTDFDGVALDGCIDGSIVVNSGATERQTFKNCTSSVAGASRPVLDCNSAVCDFQIRGYYGGLTINNFDQGGNMSIDMDAGTVELSASCTSGTIVVRGVAQLIDNSNGATVVIDGLLQPKKVAKKKDLAVLS